jgi:hypothetical protein
VSQQYPQQPGWAEPHQPQPPKKKPSAGKIVGFGCLGVVGVLVILGGIGAAVGGGKTDTKTNTTKSTTTASSSPTKAAPAKPASAKPASAKPAHPSASKQPTAAATTHAPKKPSTAEARRKAAVILEKEDQDFRDFLTQGEKVVGTPDFTAWYQKAIVGLDMQQNAFKKADAYFTADNEPTDLIEAWRSDNGDANAKITQYAMDGTSPDAPDATTRKDAADCRAALAKADKDAEKIANGS